MEKRTLKGCCALAWNPIQAQYTPKNASRFAAIENFDNTNVQRVEQSMRTRCDSEFSLVSSNRAFLFISLMRH